MFVHALIAMTAFLAGCSSGFGVITEKAMMRMFIILLLMVGLC
jgi:hypothetical protein